MARCDLTIELDRPDRTYRLGERVSGRVQVRVDRDTRCNGLVVSRQWGTHGRGNRASGPEDQATVFRGEWRAGEAASYPFVFDLPPGPITYRGHSLNVDYYIRVRADIPWAFDPKAEEEFLVTLGDDPALYDPGTNPSAAAALQSVAKAHTAFLFIFAGCFGLMGLKAAAFSLLTALTGDFSAIVGVPFGLVFVAIGAGVVFFTMRNTIAERKLGPVLLEVKPERCAPGQVVHLDLSFTPQADLELNGINASILAQERVVSGSGTRRTTHTHELQRETLDLADRRRLPAGEPVHLGADVLLPADAAWSFSASDNYVEWRVEVHIDIPGWPDWSCQRALTIVPAGKQT